MNAWVVISITNKPLPKFDGAHLFVEQTFSTYRPFLRLNFDSVFQAIDFDCS